jgi:hypothetical protein
MIRYIVVTFAHAQSIVHNAVVVSHLVDFNFCQACNPEIKDLESICSESSPMAQRPYEISLVYVQPFHTYNIHTGWYTRE